ncbi:MAG TPA: hypothetical protein VLA66_04835 [Thermoanaerobaculia bacterium]|nr:hypothetical protein [Thermoanaerobaculia bacterium]
MSIPPPTPRADRDEAYAPLEAPDALPVLALVQFTVALASRPLVRLLPRELRPYPWGILLPVAVTLVASALGALLAAWGIRRSRRPGLARLALLLNGVVLVLSALAALGILWIVRR